MTNKPAENAQETETPALQAFRTQNYASLYANTFKLRITTTDVTVSFGALTENPANPLQSMVHEVGSVTFPLAQMKVLAHHLTEAVAAWEGKFGTIRVPAKSGVDRALLAHLIGKMELSDSF